MQTYHCSTFECFLHAIGIYLRARTGYYTRSSLEYGVRRQGQQRLARHVSRAQLRKPALKTAASTWSTVSHELSK